jgi:predicted transcriptional regulator
LKGIRFRPEQEGLRSSLFDLEAEIMEIVWDAQWEEFAVSDVHDALSKLREVAYTTVMTTVSRLFDKGILERRRDGRRYLYQSKLSRCGFIEAMTREVLSSLPPIGTQTAVALLVDQVASADEGELDRLEQLIRARRGALHE